MKTQDFSVIQILREINFRGCRSPKTAIFAISRALNFVYLVNFSPLKVQKIIKSKLRASKCGKMANFDDLDSATVFYVKSE